MLLIRPVLCTNIRILALRRAYAARATPIAPEDESHAKKQLRSFSERHGETRIFPFWGMGFMALGISFYCSSLYMNYRRQAANPRTDIPDDVMDRWDKAAETFDSEVETMETTIGLNRMRKKLLSSLEGHILEAAAGTGRNIPYYPMKNIESIVMVDQSIKMLEIARERWRKDQPMYLDKVTFRHQSAIDRVKPPKPEGFDAVVQTMGLCSTPEPVALLKSLDRMTKSRGSILLLEHGRAHYDWLNNVLDATAPAHADRHGCWWNKEIGKIVEESGLEVVKIKRRHFGTTWWIELRASDKTNARTIDAQPERQTEHVTQAESPAPTKSSWWKRGWS